MNVKKYKKAIILGILLALFVHNGNAETDKTVLYENGFEKKNDFSPYLFNGNFNYKNWKDQVEIEHMGLSDEKPYSGNKLFKLSITFKKAGKYCYFRIPIRPAKLITNPLYLSAYLRVKQDSGLRVALGRGLYYQGSTRQKGGINGAGPIASDKTPDGWNFYHQNVYSAVRWVCEKGNGKAKGWDANKNYLSSILLMILGDIKPGDKVIVYIDNLKVSSQKPKLTLSSKESNVNLSFLGERKRYDIRNKIFLNPRSGNIFSNSSFELGLKDWTVNNYNDPKEPFCKVGIAKDTAYHGQQSLRISHEKQLISFISSPFLAIKNKDNKIISFRAKATGEMKINGHAVGEKWKKYNAHINTHWNYKDKYYANLKVTGYGTLWIDAITAGNQANEKFKTINALELGISLNNDNNITNVFSDKDPLTLNIALFNGSSKHENGQLSYQVKDFYHNIVKKGEFDFNLASNKGIIKNIPISTPKGIFYVYANLDKEKNIDCEQNFAVIHNLDNKKINKQSFFGSTSPNWMNHNREAGLAQRLGMKYQGIYGPCYFSSAPENWREKLVNKTLWHNSLAEDTLTHLKKYGIEPVFMIYGLPKWLVGKKNFHANGFVPEEKFVKEWGDYIFNMVKHFKGRVKYWEIWGEVVHSRKDAKNFLPFLKQAYIMAKKADPDCVIIGCGFDPGISMVNNAKYMFEQGALKYLDKISIHPYFIHSHSSPEVGNVESSIKKINSLMKKYGGTKKDIWITEVSYQGTNTYYADVPGPERHGYNILISEERMADYIARMMLIAMANRVQKFLLFPTLHSGIKIYSSFYGLTYENCTEPKAGLPAYSTLAAYLSDATAGEEIKLAPGFKCYLYHKPDNKVVAAVWNSSDNKNALSQLAVPQGDYRFIDLMNNSIIPKEKNNLKIVTLHGGSPILITGDNYLNLKDQLTKAKIIALVPTARLSLSNDLKFLKLEIKNNAPRKLDCRAIIKQAPAEWGIKRHSYNFIVSKGSSKIITIPLTDIILSSINNKALEVAVQMGKTHKLLKFKPLFCHQLPITFNSDSLLKNKKGIRSLTLSKNNFTSLLSKKTAYDETDIKGKFYSGWNSKGLYLAFDVNDNRFFQPYVSSGIWAGDSVQIAFDALSNPTKNEGYNADDSEYGLALTDKGPEAYCFIGRHKGKVNRIKLKIIKAGKNIYYQAFFPWNIFENFIPTNGASMGFNFTIMDNDGGKTTKKFLYLSEGIAGENGKNPFSFYDFIFTQQINS